MDPFDCVNSGDGKHATARVSRHESSVVRNHDGWDQFYRDLGGFQVALYEPGKAPDELGVPVSEFAELRAAGIGRLVHTVTESARIGSGDHVVDAGCGIGAAAIWLACKHGCRVVGVNINHHELERARELAKMACLSAQVNFNWADCSQILPFGDDSVDAVVCMRAACQFSDRNRFLCEVRRVLRPGGRLVLEDFFVPDGLSSDDRRLHVAPFCRAWSLHSLESRGSYAGKLVAANLEPVEFSDFGTADAYNLRVAEIHHRNSAIRLLCGREPGLKGWHDAWATLALGWRNGHITHERLLARKP